MSLIHQASRTATDLLRDALHFVFPATCATCERDIGANTPTAQFICTECLQSIERLERPWCEQCADPLQDENVDLCERCALEDVGFDLARSFGIYDGPLARAIQQLKYEKEQGLTHDLAQLLRIQIAEERPEHTFDAITFVPMSADRKFKRGFNQAELLARKLGNTLKLPVISALRKSRTTRPQMELSGDERRQNLIGAFSSVNSKLPKRMLVIDDVFTTGTTISECGKALKAAGVHEVFALTLARAPLTDAHED